VNRLLEKGQQQNKEERPAFDEEDE